MFNRANRLFVKINDGSGVSLSGLFNEFQQAGDLGLGFGRHQLLELIFRHPVFQIMRDVKIFPPAIQNFKTRMLIVVACLTVFKGDRIA